MYSWRKPLLFDRQFRNQLEEHQVKCWLNLRNDDLFVLRWGGPDFVRDYIQQMPHDVVPGFYMGSDGYVWGREFIAKNPEMAGRLEIDKHWYRLEALAEDNTGTFARREMQVVVGDVSENDAVSRSDEIYKVVLQEGERLMDGEIREFPRLECDLKINEEGRLVLHGVIRGKSRDRKLLWNASMYKSHGSHYAALEKGRLVIYRGTPDYPGAAPFKTPPVSGPGPYKLGIAVSKELVIIREVDGEKRETVWLSNS